MLRTTLFTSVSLFAFACGGEESGTITATVYGEEFIEDGIPVAGGEDPGFSDGWTLAFDKFLVSIGNAKAATDVGAPEFYIVDLAQSSGGEGFELTEFAAPGGAYDHYGYSIRPEAAATGTNAVAADVTAMKAAGYSIWIKGTAMKGGVTKTLDWGFKLKLDYSNCEAETEIDGNDATIQATIHSDHLFFDDATSPEPDIAFQLVADADGKAGAAADGMITLAELEATDIRTQTRYQVGSLRDSAGQAIVNLKQYIEVQATTVGHINGEGHCADVAVAP